MKKIKTLLMSVYCKGMQIRFEEVGISCITAYLRSFGYEVMLLGVKEEEVDYKAIEAFSPDIVGMPVYDINKNTIYNTSRNLKEMLPNAVICVGGNLPTYYGEEILEECSSIACAIRGEGEQVMLEIVKKLESGEGLKNVKGVTFRDGNAIVVNADQPLLEDMDLLPFPARDILAQNSYGVAQITTSRGCMAKCSFCASQLFWKKWRGRCAKHVVDEIEQVAAAYNIKMFNFVDGSFEDPGGDCERVLGIAEEIIKRNLNIHYFAHIRAEFQRKANHEIMQILKQSGLCGVCIGLESGNRFDLDLYGKLATQEDMDKVIELFRKYQINIEPGFINFNPYSTFEGLRLNINFLERHGFASNIEHVVTIYKMYKGTRLYNRVKEDKLLCDGKFNEFGYEFMDNRLRQLHSYLYDYVMKRDENTIKACSAIIYYTTKHLTLLTYYRGQFEKFTMEDAMRVLEVHEQENRDIRDELNVNIARWFRALLELAETGWDVECAENISAQMLSNDYLMDAAVRFDSKRRRFFISLLRKNPEYQKFFIDIS